ncbi:hypothetical protein OC846_005124 [Tilletia horrida]|uniref:Uncharacterized protein n=1 Tax=Tilletia horrida TaxID=155126 RepID=A0AAN6GLY2_9BASI|nr:hypothetical protein OC846_005124 [Tilletia horrida]KAK0553748.1 hypothetical protein OC845_001038 [Tilletia horrida]KAK0562406.1 hypothetical protein OC861_005345 [Tilletia horrida]
MAEHSSSTRTSNASRKRSLDAADGDAGSPAPLGPPHARVSPSSASDAAEAAQSYDKDQHILDALRQWSTSKRSDSDREQLMAKLNLGEGFRQSWRNDVQQERAVNGDGSGSLGAWFDALPTTLPSGGDELRSIRAELEAIVALSQASRNAGAAAQIPEPLLKRARTSLEAVSAARLPARGSSSATDPYAAGPTTQNSQTDRETSSSDSHALLALSSSSSRNGAAPHSSSSEPFSAREHSPTGPRSPPGSNATGTTMPSFRTDSSGNGTLTAPFPTPAGPATAQDPTYHSSQSSGHTTPSRPFYRPTDADPSSAAAAAAAAATVPGPSASSSRRTLGDYMNPWPLNPALAGTFAHFYRGPLTANQVTEILKQDISKSARRALTGQHTGYLGYFHFVGLDDGNLASSRGPRPGPRRMREQPLPTLEKWQCRVCHTELRVPPARVSNLGTHLYGLGARNPRKRGCFVDNLATPAEAVPPPDRDDAGNIVPIGATSRRRRGVGKPDEGQPDEGQEE